MKCQPKSYRRRPKRGGLILLVVLSSLAFFSVLIAAFLVFSNQAQESAFALSVRNTRTPEYNELLNDALMTLIRGTSDVNHPFYGESLLDDYWGHDGNRMRAQHLSQADDPNNEGPFNLGTGLIRFPVVSADTGLRLHNREIDDLYSGRVITFLEGPLRNRSFRVLRSLYRPDTPVTPPQMPTINRCDDLFIDTRPTDIAVGASINAIRSLFYRNPNDLRSGAYAFFLNGQPLNSPGVGFDGTDVDATVGEPGLVQRNPFAPATPVGFADLPAALQPNHLPVVGSTVDKSTIHRTLGGDFDEDYDAPDFNNWFLAHQGSDGNIIPSFHRPSVINYIVNEVDWSASAYPDYTQRIWQRFREPRCGPIPIAQSQFGPRAIHGKVYRAATRVSLCELRYCLDPSPFSAPPTIDTIRPSLNQRLNQLTLALTNGPWDVDNDSDGIADSIWVNLGLPQITSREGKLLQPMIAPMIEDLSSRINVNANGNRQLALNTGGLQSNQALWAGTRQPLGSEQRFVFRGIGFGPAEIGLPMVDSNGPISSAAIQAEIRQLLNERYQFGDQALQAIDVAGRPDGDSLDIVRTGYRPPFHLARGGWGYSEDPFGRGGVGMGRSGNILTSHSGLGISADNPTTPQTEPLINEAINDPYEMDPSGRLSGDLAYQLSELEALLRGNEFDSDLLPRKLRDRLNVLMTTHPEFLRSLTTYSASDDSLIIPDQPNAYLAIVEWYDSIFNPTAPPTGPAPATALTPAQLTRLLPPEFRLGRKIDVNRPFANRIDDNGNGVIDEPAEVMRAENNGVDDDGDGTTDEDGELLIETQAFVATAGAGTVPVPYQGQEPFYVFDEPRLTVGPTAGWPVTLGQVNGRQLLARHLYILMMALTSDGIDFPSVVAPAMPPMSFSSDAYRARRLAQWAVNVVDYRDPDSIMTRFVYDPNPFDGWDAPDAQTAPGVTPSEQFVVWGVESPHLVFSESAAYHDVRLKDIDRDNGDGEDKSGANEEDSDQLRIPQGSLLLELYCPMPPVAGDQNTKPAAPQELYVTAADGTSVLDLARNAPPLPGSGAVVGAPVWRIAISEPHYPGTPNEDLDPSDLRSDIPDSYSFDPQIPDELEDPSGMPNTAPLAFDRFVVFRNFANADTNPDSAFNDIATMLTDNAVADMSAEEVFFAPAFDGDAVTNSNRGLEPGQFLNLVPRLATVLGSKEYMGAYPGIESEQRIVVSPAEGVLVSRHDNTRLSPSMAGGATDPFSPARTLVIGAPRPSGWVAPAAHPHFAQRVVGLNVSEPLPRGGSYYPEPMFRFNGTEDQDSNGDEDYELTDGYIDYTDPASRALDKPLDVTRGRLRITGPDPLADDAEPRLGTEEQFCTAFLQRLADPTMAYHPEFNPYRTIDWIPIDLTVFSGEARENDISGAARNYSRRTRQRNGQVRTFDGGLGPRDNALFSNVTDFNNGLAQVGLDTLQEDFFAFDGTGPQDRHILTSISFLNTDTPQINPGFLGFAASIGRQGAAVSVLPMERNLPQIPYAMHPWLNRPYASHLELMMVPACSQGRLFEEFATVAGDPDIYPEAGMPDDPGVFYAPHRHLLNFFHTGRDSAEGAGTSHFFDFVHTLPRFRGEVEMLEPSRLSVNSVPMRQMRTLLRPPFCFRAEPTRQGRICLNTVGQFSAYAGLMQGHLFAGEFNGPAGAAMQNQLSFNEFVESRRGYTVPGTDSFVTLGAGPYNYAGNRFSADYPTQFAAPFRSSESAGFMPELRDAGITDLWRRRGANAGLLRGANVMTVADPVGGAPGTTSLFVRDSMQLTGDHVNRNRNPLIRYQTLTRMPNLSSNGSQVFAIRLTLGFFEVDPADTNSIGREYKADIGENQRYRGLFIVDRSRPVGFIPGEDLNSREIVMFESYEQ